jgi:hypothetical protein
VEKEHVLMIQDDVRSKIKSDPRLFFLGTMDTKKTRFKARYGKNLNEKEMNTTSLPLSDDTGVRFFEVKFILRKSLQVESECLVCQFQAPTITARYIVPCGNLAN